VLGSPEPWWLRAPSLDLGLGWRRRPGGSHGIRSKLLSIGSMRLGRDLESKAEARGRARARPNTLAGGYAQAYPMGMALEPPGDVGRVGRGSLGQEPLILRLNIPLCLDLVTWESTSWCTNHSRMNHSHLPSASSLDYVCH
jgi:hypothetical protein